MDLLVPAPTPDICVRLWKNCPRPASHVVPRLTDRLHRDRTAILMPSTVRSSGAPPLVCDGKGYFCRPPCVPRSPTVRSSGAPPLVSDGKGCCRPPCVPLVRLHSCPTLENCRSTTGRLHRDGTAILMPSTVRFLVRLHCAFPGSPPFRSKPSDRSPPSMSTPCGHHLRVRGLRRECGRLRGLLRECGRRYGLIVRLHGLHGGAFVPRVVSGARQRC